MFKKKTAQNEEAKGAATLDGEQWKSLAEDRGMELDDKKEEIKKMNDALQALKSSYDKLFTVVDEKRMKLDKLEKKVKDTQASEQDALHKYNVTKDFLDTTNKQLDTTNKQLESTNKTLEEVSHHAADVEAECRKFNHMNEKLKKQMEEMNYDHQNTVRRMSKEIETLTKSRDGLRDRSDKDVTTKDDEHWKKIADERGLELDDKQKELDKLNIQMKALKEEKEKLVDEVDGRRKIINGLEEKVNEAYISEQKAIGEFSAAREVLERTNMQLVEVTQHAADMEAECRKLYHKRDKMKKMIGDMNYDHQNTVRKMSEEIDTLTKSRDDLRDRYSKVAGQKLNENNPDIADLSTPDRAVKLAERFSAIYDDQWTAAFEEQQENMKDSVGNLLEVLKVCYKFCEETAKGQMLVLENVFLHPCQGTDLERNPKGGQAGLLDKPRINSAQEQMLKDVRRKIASDLVPEVKAQFLAQMRKDEATDKKAMQCSMPYYEKCVEICWLMVLHDPPLHIDVDVQPGARMDSNIFTSFATSGNVIEYLVWPPLFNGKGGGLLSKGTALPTKCKTASSEPTGGYVDGRKGGNTSQTVNEYVGGRKK